MFTITGMNEVALTLENVRGDPALLESLLYEVGKEIERIAKREMEWGKFRKPHLSSSKPFLSSMRMDARGPATKLGFGSGIRISRLTPESVTVTMPREVLGRVAMRLPEIEEYLTAILRGR